MKYIDADKLIDRLDEIFNDEVSITYIKNLIDDLSEEREEYQFTIEDIVEFVEWTNLHYRALEHTKSIKNVKDTNELFKLWKKNKS